MLGQYQIYRICVIAQMVLAGHIMFPMIGRYHIYIIFVITQMVPAGHSIFPMIGQYQIYIICVITQMVPAGHIMFPMIGQYQIYIIWGDHISGTGQSYHHILILSTNYQYNVMIVILEYKFGWVSRTHVYIPSAGCRVVPLLQVFVHVRGTRSATIFD